MNAIDRLISLNLIGYGKFIDKQTMETILDLEYSNSWEWLGPYLELRSQLIERGYFVSTRNVEEGALRFLEIHEIPDQLKKRRLKRYKSIIMDTQVSKRLPYDSLELRNQKMLFDEQIRSGKEISYLCSQDKEFRKMICEED